MTRDKGAAVGEDGGGCRDGVSVWGAVCGGGGGVAEGDKEGFFTKVRGKTISWSKEEAGETEHGGSFLLFAL